jgi:hypothetical protein
MHKRHLYHLLKQLYKVRAWYFVAAIIVSLAVSIAALRQNNLQAIQLRDEVIKVDQQNGDVEAALRNLRQHVYGHMNSNLAAPGGAYPPVQLKYRYERLLAAEKERVTAANGTLYTEAQAYCERIIPEGRSLNRIDCIQDYITQRGGSAERAIPDALYKFDFQPPLWSPDLAGWSLVITGLLIVAFISRALTVAWLKYRIGQQQ